MGCIFQDIKDKPIEICKVLDSTNRHNGRVEQRKNRSF
jgi:hypothetical protein